MPYDIELVARAALALVAFAFGLAGHYVGDHWIQTSPQACRKALNGGDSRTVAMWHCAKHVVTWAATVTVFIAGAAWWLHLPLRPGWLIAGMTLNAVTHFVADLRTPLIWIVRLVGRGGYVDNCHVVRTAGAPAETTGPGTAAFELDQSWHIAWLAVSALVIAGPM
jgi:hypothetical protein